MVSGENEKSVAHPNKYESEKVKRRMLESSIKEDQYLAEEE